MSAKAKNPQAFPQLSIESGERDGHGDLIQPFTTSEGGMTLRDYFAAAALTGIVNNYDADLSIFPEQPASLSTVEGHEWLAATAYDLADAMLKTRQK